MAYLNIHNDPCPKCGSTATIEEQDFLHTDDYQREIFLKCLKCKERTSYGVYKLIGRNKDILVKV